MPYECGNKSDFNYSNSPYAGAGAIEKSWLNFIKLCIENCEIKPDETQVCICPQGSPFSSNITNDVIPSVILWNPLSHACKQVH